MFARRTLQRSGTWIVVLLALVGLMAVTPAAADSSVVLSPVADAYVNGSAPAANNGSSSSLATYGSPDVHSFLRFALPAAPSGQALSGATLRVRSTTLSSAGSTNTQQVRPAPDTWAENTLTWNNRPTVTGAVIGTLAAPSAVATSYDITLDPAALAGLLGANASLAMFGTGPDSFWFTSREWGTVSERPTLTLRFTTTSGADTTAPTAPGTPTATVSATTVNLSWSAATDNVAVTGYDIHRSPTSGFTPTAATRIGGATTTTYSDPNRPAGTAHYRVIAKDAAANTSLPSGQANGTVASSGDTTVMAVGDIACAPGSAVTATTCRHGDVADVVASAPNNFFVPLGDLQYEKSTYAELTGAGAYNAEFGSFKARTLPIVGNHEYLDPAGPGAGYFDYFYGQGVNDGAVGARPDGYYARTLGSWQFIALNSECAPDSSNGNKYLVGGCAPGSAQYRWLESVLASNTARCTVVAFHRPRWTTGAHSSYTAMGPMWDLMVQAGVDVTLSGHNHSSEIFRRIGASGTAGAPVLSPGGIRSFVAGGGGKNTYPFTDSSSAVFQALQARDSTTFGPLRLTLKDGSFDWAFMPVAGQTFTNAGTTGSFSGAGEPCS